MVDTLYSGGAQGADTVFSMCAESVGHYRVHFSFHGHKCDIAGKVILHEVQLETYTEELKKAAKTLGKSYASKAPEHPRFKYIRNLLARNAWQVFGDEESGPSEALYAVALLNKARTNVEGGTGWAVALATRQTEIPVYVFDLKSSSWYTWVEDQFHPTEEPPKPSGVYTGVGSRKLTDAGIEAIGKLYGLEDLTR